ncbi:MAG: hypothetical protein SVM80_09660 [Halobacteriota archaeon]|nr:hypothetical protein [Halobacteriota archaeon]
MEEKRKFRLKGRYITIPVIIILLLVLYFSISVETTDPIGSESYPYTVTYNVTFPATEEVTVGNNKLFAIPGEDEVILSVNGEKKEISVGTTYEMQEIGVKAKILGIQVYDTDARISFEYIGKVEDDANFYLRVSTSSQIPEFMLSMTLPSEIEAKPA